MELPADFISFRIPACCACIYNTCIVLPEAKKEIFLQKIPGVFDPTPIGYLFHRGIDFQYLDYLLTYHHRLSETIIHSSCNDL